ncbi:MAG: CRISPR-associated helicase Cas3' [Planctomycetota bacterium]|nr:MAG: CRISPR-associated helicase Cas3' [Planctomycetota bacterium]
MSPYPEPSMIVFWGKLRHEVPDDRKSPVIDWLPLVDHCADVAAVAVALLGCRRDESTGNWSLQPSLLRRRLACLAGLEDFTIVQCLRLGVCAALHDIGKANNSFQEQWRGTRDRPQRMGHVNPALWLLRPIAAAFFGNPWKTHTDAFGLDAIKAWFDGDGLAMIEAAICHHGGPPAQDDQRTESNTKICWGEYQGRKPLDGLANLGRACHRWFADAYAHNGDPIPVTTGLTHAFAGLVMLVDWMGSDTEAFPWDVRGEQRFPLSCQRALQLLRETRMDTTELHAMAAAPDWQKLLPTGELRAAQHLVNACPLPEGGSVAVLEAATGDGKTEAALFHFARLFAAGLVDGCYFAVPTRIAARQLHRRITALARTILGDQHLPVVLAVPGYAQVEEICPEETGPRALPEQGVLYEDNPVLRERHRWWAAERPKRFLAAPVAVGTIDQALLAGLKVRHGHLRGTCLLRHLLIVDEVHASDVYMGTILQGLLQRQVDAGGHALLLSATLGLEAREALLQSAGHQEAVPALQQAINNPYPSLILADQQGRQSIPLADSPIPTRTRAFALHCQPWMDDYDRLCSEVMNLAQAGARVLIIRNTVADTVHTMKRCEVILQTRGLPEHLLFRVKGKACPHHARFAAADRLLLDNTIESVLGGDRCAHGMVVVASQTAEQSLDIDADILFTDLAPMDVLLQRLGRCHRHDRERDDVPSTAQQPSAIILTPEHDDLSAYLGRMPNRHGLGPMRSDSAEGVYPSLRILTATWETLREHPRVEIPRDNRRLVEYSLHQERLAGHADDEDAWQRHDGTMAGANMAKRSHAKRGLVDWQHTPFMDAAAPPEEQVATRLGDLPRLITFADPVTSPFGNRLHELAIPAWMIHGDIAETIHATQEEPGTCRFQAGDQSYRYSQYGIEIDD